MNTEVLKWGSYGSDRSTRDTVDATAARLYHSKRTTAGPLVPLIPSDLKKRAEDGSTDKDRNYEIGIYCGFIRSRSSHYSR